MTNDEVLFGGPIGGSMNGENFLKQQHKDKIEAARETAKIVERVEVWFKIDNEQLITQSYTAREILLFQTADKLMASSMLKMLDELNLTLMMTLHWSDGTSTTTIEDIHHGPKAVQGSA